MSGGPMNILLIVVSIFVAFILLMAFSEPVNMIFDTMKTSGESTDSGKEGPYSVKNQTAAWNLYGNSIYSIVFGATMIGGAIALFLGIAIKRRTPQYYESERYGGDYEY